MTRSEITIKDVSWDNLGVIPSTLEGIIRAEGDDIYIRA
jgi:UDP-N-acetylglucosamine 1-carboxyvinyltransferase